MASTRAASEQILKSRFAELKKTREAALRRRKQPDWTDQLILDNGRQDHRQSREPDPDLARGTEMERGACLRRIQRAGRYQRAPAMGTGSTQYALDRSSRVPGASLVPARG